MASTSTTVPAVVKFGYNSFRICYEKSGQQNAIIAQLQLQKLEALRLDLLSMMMC